jgi:hypothetical protein
MLVGRALHVDRTATLLMYIASGLGNHHIWYIAAHQYRTVAPPSQTVGMNCVLCWLLQITTYVSSNIWEWYSPPASKL